MQVIQVTVSIDSKEAAQRIAMAVIEKKLGACVQVSGPITSTYTWEDQVQMDEEWLCVIKTTLECYSDLEAMIVDLHHYEVPEILAVPVDTGFSLYMDWIRESVR